MERVFFKKILLTVISLFIFSLICIDNFHAFALELIDMYVVGEYTESWEIQPAWSPADPGAIAYVKRDGRWGEWAIGLISMPQGIKNELTQNKNYEYLDPAWSPDGKRISCSVKKDNKAPWEIMIIDIEKKTETTLNSEINTEAEIIQPFQGDYAPCYSSDGKKIVFIHCDEVGNKDVCVMDADGNNRNKLTANPSLIMGTPRWSPDGKKILFVQDENVWVMNADGSNAMQLTADSKFNENPAWSPDGKMIAYSSCAGKNLDIWMMNSDGTNKIQLTLSQEAEDFPSWSPDGKRIAFQIGHIKGRIWVIELK